MKVYGNDLTVYRHETFTYDKFVVGRDGSPYIVNKALTNPYVLITIASTKYEQEGRYVYNVWLDLDYGYDINGNLVQLPRFETTKPYKLTTFSGLPTGHEYDTAVYYTEDAEGNKDYRRYDINTGTFVPYYFRIVKAFDNATTRNWVEQNYVYSVQLLAGTTTLEYLQQLYSEYYDDEVPADVQTLYDLIKAKDADIVSELNITRPLASYSAVQILVEPSKLTVLSDINGGI